MANANNHSFSPSSLFCRETEACFDGEDEEEEEEEDDDDRPVYSIYCDNPCFVVAENEGEFIENLVQRETMSFGSRMKVDDCSRTSLSWLKCARLDAIEWIFNTRAVFGFQHHTAYLSITFLDRFLSRRSIEDGKLWAIRLLSVACLSLAAKMEECRVPALSEFAVDDYVFEDKVIQRMELLVLSTLEWKMSSVTPFAYLHFFILKFCGEEARLKELVSKAVELILAIPKEINLMNHRPSAIAAAAVLAASSRKLTTKEMKVKMEVISSWVSLENERVFSCYNLMQEIEMGEYKTPKVFSPKLSTLHCSSTDVLESSCLASGAGSKRRLTFSELDQNSPVKKICRTLD